MSEWTYAYHDSEFRSTSISGKWLLFFSPQFRDEWWQKVQEATMAGDLGPAAKVSNTPRGNRYCICVYCEDGEKERAGMEIREKLRELGVGWVISFKFCWMSRAGKSGSAFSA